MEVLDAVAGRDEMDAFGVSGGAQGDVQAGEQRTVGRRFGSGHIGEIDEVPPGDDLHGAWPGCLGGAVLDQPELIAIDPAAGRFIGGGAQMAVRAGVVVAHGVLSGKTRFQ
ncbi:hypothetical protein [Microtetraspora sp. NBRC 13810]|uniref:hypothetical protein n=1 Tax=Microtetraspora sp. NBRC 13810 TaxID=3030990 RepID=UPI0025544B50|nr:hypothetical protein [Microtetraspora sp. NBRC 13810]